MRGGTAETRTRPNGVMIHKATNKSSVFVIFFYALNV